MFFSLDGKEPKNQEQKQLAIAQTPFARFKWGIEL